MQNWYKDIVGTWLLVSAAAYGPNPIGQFTFDATGHFSSMLAYNVTRVMNIVAAAG